jgi:hypothetical protein
MRPLDSLYMNQRSFASEAEGAVSRRGVGGWGGVTLKGGGGAEVLRAEMQRVR